MIRVTLAVARRPSLWSTAVRQLRRTAAPRWWAHPPFVPRPPEAYLGFRLVTQYGDSDHRPVPADVVNYLAWCKRWHDHQ
ncbi:MAG: hypothetical protein ACRDZZ_00655 [Ilumatobacteraceae bacterium]